MPVIKLSSGLSTLLVANQTYALPATATVISWQNAGSVTIEVSNDGINWSTLGTGASGSLTTAAAFIRTSAADTTVLPKNAVIQMSSGGSAIGLFSDHISIGPLPASQGAIRLTNFTGIYARNPANDGDMQLVHFGSDGTLYMGGGANVNFTTNNVAFTGSTGVSFYTTTGLISFVPLGVGFADMDGTSFSPNIASNNLADLGKTTLRWRNIYSNGFTLVDGVTAPATIAGHAVIYVDTADGDLKVKFGDGVIKTIAVDV